MAERFLVNNYPAAEGVAVPENVAKKAARNAKLTAEKKSAKAELRKATVAARHGMKMRAQHYEKEYKLAEKQLIRMRREAKQQGNFFVEPEAKLIFCTRIAGINKMAPKPRKIMHLLRLMQLHNGVFLKVTRPIINMLRYINPYVTFGYPNLKTVRELVYKRGHVKVNKQRLPITNELITEKLGQFGIEGVEDLIHEIYTAGPHFKEASNFLWPFKLSAPRGGFVKKRAGFAEPNGGDWGNREEEINELIRRMN